MTQAAGGCRVCSDGPGPGNPGHSDRPGSNLAATVPGNLATRQPDRPDHLCEDQCVDLPGNPATTRQHPAARPATRLGSDLAAWL